MPTELTSRQRRLWLGAAVVILLVLTALQLRSQGRLWLCACGELYLWAGDIQSAHNSQHLSDPYSFTHLLHGLAFFWVLTLAAGRFSSELQVGLTVLLESVWEVLENSRFIIERYREATIALGYEGDTIVNSVADIGICTGCALQAHEIQSPEMAAVAKPSQQPCTESCVVFGNGHCEA